MKSEDFLADWEVTGANIIWRRASHFLGVSQYKKVLLVLKDEKVDFSQPPRGGSLLKQCSIKGDLNLNSTYDSVVTKLLHMSQVSSSHAAQLK